MQSDERGFRIAVVASELVNDEALDVMGVLERYGWGAIVLPPEWYARDVQTELLVQFAEHIEEFARHGYDVVCIGSCQELAGPLNALGVRMPDAVRPDAEEELARFLEGRDVAAPGG